MLESQFEFERITVLSETEELETCSKWSPVVHRVPIFQPDMGRMVSPVCMCVMLVRTVVVAFVVVVVDHLLQVVLMIMVMAVVVVLRAFVGHVLLALGEQGHAEEAEAVTNHQTPHLERCFQITHPRK